MQLQGTKSSSPISIRKALEQDIPYLPAVERSAARLYESTNASFNPEQTLSTTALQRMIQSETVWIALEMEEVVAFAACFPTKTALHLQELSVRHEFQRRGIGRRLIQCVIEHARNIGIPAVTLCTFQSFQWCMPFYQRIGFVVVQKGEMSEELKQIWEEDEMEFGDGMERVAMMIGLGS